MMPAAILGNQRPGMIAGAAMLHLAVLAGAWVAIPSGTVTRLDRPIEASFAPMPSADQVNAESTPLAEEVKSTVEQADPAPEQTARTVKDDAAAAVPVEVAEQSAVAPTPEKPLQPDEAEAESAPSVQPPTQAETARLEQDRAQTAASAPELPAQAVPDEPAPAASVVPDVITALASDQEVASPSTAPQAEAAPAASVPSAQPDPAPVPQPPAKPETVKPEIVKPKAVEPASERRRKMAARRVKTRDAAEKAPEGKPDRKTVVRRAQQGGAGAVSDVGVSDNARRSGATSRNYDAVILAQIRSHLRFPAGARDRGVEGTAAVSFAVSGQGAVGGVHLARSSNDSTLDAAALALVRGLSLPPPPYHPYVRTVPVRYALR